MAYIDLHSPVSSSLYTQDETKYLNQELKKYFNSDLDTSIHYIYHYNIQKNQCIDLNFLKENIVKNNNELISLLKNKDMLDDYHRHLIFLLIKHNINTIKFHQELEKTNEKTNIRKSKGVYYTPEDVTEYIIYNSIYQLILHKINQKSYIKGVDEIKQELSHILKEQPDLCCFIIHFKTLDPTCGTGAFLTKLFECKIDILSKIHKKITDNDIYRIISSIFGNDIDEYSIYITKIRLLFKVLHINKLVDIKKIFHYLDLNFYHLNFIQSHNNISHNYHLVIGNPPYVEKRTVEYADYMKYGNLYADVLHNSVDLLEDNGVMGYIVPISYISTTRMEKIRNYIKKNTLNQFILSYSDRPDCLFVGVHQKLNIIIAQKCKNHKSFHTVYTSDYKYWYKSERSKIFSNNDMIVNKFCQDDFYPKLSSQIEQDIFSKIHLQGQSILSRQTINERYFLYLNKRATFWIKSFIKEPYNSNEYSIMYYNKDYIHLINCVLNSSLYWFYWIKISDCWHLTNKELSNFYIPDISKYQADIFKKLSIKLNNMLEKTKVKIDTKQAMYEYKHRLCKEYIDLIDDELAKLYNLTKNELNYIKKYQLYYRSAGELYE